MGRGGWRGRWSAHVGTSARKKAGGRCMAALTGSSGQDQETGTNDNRPQALHSPFSGSSRPLVAIPMRLVRSYIRYNSGLSRRVPREGILRAAPFKGSQALSEHAAGPRSAGNHHSGGDIRRSDFSSERLGRSPGGRHEPVSTRRRAVGQPLELFTLVYPQGHRWHQVRSGAPRS